MIFHYSLFEFKRVLKSPALLLFVISLPVAFVFIVGMLVLQAAQSELDEVELVVIDEDQTFETETLIQQLEGDETLEEHVEFIRVDGEVEAFTDESNIAAIIRVPEGFTSQLRSGINEPIDVYLNEGQPFASQLGYLLLQSGQDYITAAQSGVNTVNYFIGSQLEGDERSDFVQQMTVHFTLLSLGRNSLFDEQHLTEINALSWLEQAYVAVISLLYVLTLLFYNFLFKPKTWSSINERLSLIRLTSWKRALGQSLHLITFSLIYLMLFGVLVPSIWFEFSFGIMLVQWSLVAIVFIFLYVVLDYLLKVPAFSLTVFSLFSALFLLSSGLMLPAAFLPEWLQIEWLQSVSEAFYHIFNEGNAPLYEWGMIVLMALVLLVLLRLATRRGETSS
ncbi:ABC transporter permease [Alkalibacillus silvisoli]|uniref:ABC-2 type transporter transmembrane domain-containing protein n=1 Tax=Alkalibacillus silvisoli TaxID=392823 RepID=A0ABN1A9I1_9BACI